MRRAPLSRVLDAADISWDYGSNKLLCPACGDGYTGAGEPETVAGKDDYQAGWGGRGDLVKIPFVCENGGHEFAVCVGFHKGESFCFVEWEANR